jgi:glycosyltransferase involved in cell wall biosynthesis
MKPEFTIIIPAWNEHEVIGDAIFAVEKFFKGKNFELLIINDGSSDGTAKIVNSLKRKYKNLRLISHSKNMGMGAALSTGFANARGSVVINMDADLTHPLSKVPKMLSWIKKGYDVVICSRYMARGGMKDVPYWRQAISIVCNKIFRFFFWSNIHDMTSGYRAYKNSVAKRINLQSKKFEAPLESSVKSLKLGLKIKEIPIMLGLREKGNSKFNYGSAVRTYIPMLFKLFIYRWFSRRDKL